MLRHLAVGAVVAVALATPASASAEPICIYVSTDHQRCVNDPRDVLPHLIAAPGPCLVDIGYCAPGSHCTVNVGYCAPGGDCVVNVGYCDDNDLPVGL